MTITARRAYRRTYRTEAEAPSRRLRQRRAGIRRIRPGWSLPALLGRDCYHRRPYQVRLAKLRRRANIRRSIAYAASEFAAAVLTAAMFAVVALFLALTV